MRRWILLLVMLAVAPAYAADDRLDNAGGFVRRCFNASDGDHKAMCLGFTIGMVEAFESAKMLFDWRDSDLCVPDAITMIERENILLRYLVKDPGRQKMNTGGAFVFAMREAFPCMTRGTPVPGRMEKRL